MTLSYAFENYRQVGNQQSACDQRAISVQSACNQRAISVHFEKDRRAPRASDDADCTPVARPVASPVASPVADQLQAAAHSIAHLGCARIARDCTLIAQGLSDCALIARGLLIAGVRAGGDGVGGGVGAGHLKGSSSRSVPIYERLKRDALMAGLVLVYVLVGLVFFAQVDRA